MSCAPTNLSSGRSRLKGPGTVLSHSAQLQAAPLPLSPVRARLWLPWDRVPLWGTVAHSARDQGSVGWISGGLGPWTPLVLSLLCRIDSPEADGDSDSRYL